MHHIRAKNRYEIDGKTVLDVYEHNIWTGEGNLPEIGEKVTFSSINDSPGKHDIGLFIQRSIMVVDNIKAYGGGYYVTVSLDIDSLPVSKRSIDGFTARQYYGKQM